MKILSPALFALSLIATAIPAVASPAKAPTKTPILAKTGITIDPRARAICARAAKLYAATQKLSARWTGRLDDRPLVNTSLDFDRAGRVRLVNSNDYESLVVVDGKTRWGVEIARDNKGRLAYTKVAAEQDEALSAMNILGHGITIFVGDLLGKVSPLDADEVEVFRDMYGVRAFRAAVLAPQPFGGGACDLVRITTISSTFAGTERLEQQTYWFARSDGRLMRMQGKLTHGGKPKSAGDWQMKSQTFNPTFAPDTFKFTPPKGAILNKDEL